MSSYVDNFLSKLDQVQEESDGWLALCPCHLHNGGQGDHHPSLRITIGEEGKILVHCRGGCPSRDVLNDMGFLYRDLYPGPNDTPATEKTFTTSVVITPADIEHRDRVYSYFLEQLSLERSEATSLRHRGLPSEVIQRNGYRTFRVNKLAPVLRKMEQKFGDDLYNVPGFLPHPLRTSLKIDGLLIPCRDEQGRIAALKLRRRGDEHPRYMYFSGGGGASCGAILHHSLGQDLTFAKVIVVTEGELKADVISHVQDQYVISLPGVNNYHKLLPALVDLNLNTKSIYLALDWADITSKPQVWKACKELFRLLHEAEYEVGLYTWDSEKAKGMDDALASKVPVQLHFGEKAVTEALTKAGTSSQGTDDTYLMDASTPPSWIRWDWKPMPFPLGCLPKDLALFCERLAESTNTPVDYAASASLVAAGCAVGSTRKVRMTPGWSEYCSIYMALVGDSGTRKSSILGNVMGPVIKRYRDLCQAAGGDEDSVPHLFTTNATVESLVTLLKDSPRGICMFFDEYMSWIQGNDQYKGGKGNDRQFFLTAWSCSSYKVDRKGSGSLFLPHPFLGIVGGLTPDNVPNLSNVKASADGFLQRMLFAIPDDPPLGILPKNFIDPTTKDLWVMLLDKLYGLEFASGNPQAVELTTEAYRIFENWYQNHSLQVGHKAFPSVMKGSWAKFSGYLGRFALLIRLMETQDPEGLEPVNKDDMLRAVEIVEYYKHTTCGMFRLYAAKPADVYLQRLCWLGLNNPNQTVMLRDARVQLGIQKISDTVELFRRAADLDIGKIVTLANPKTKEKEQGFQVFAKGEENN